MVYSFKMHLRKKAEAEPLINETTGIILAVICVAILAVLLFSLLASGYNEGKEKAKSYLSSFKESISSADNGYPADFSLWAQQNKGEAKLFLVYFGKLSSFEYSGTRFVHLGKNENMYCVCYFLENVICKECVELEFPSSYEEKGDYSSWAISQGQRINITLEGESYVIRKV